MQETKHGYSWDQGGSDVCIGVKLPVGVGSKQLNVVIAASDILVEVKGGDELLRGALCHQVVPDESSWSVADGVLEIALEKAYSDDTQLWDCIVKEHRAQRKYSDIDDKELEDPDIRSMLEDPGFPNDPAVFAKYASNPKVHSFMERMMNNLES